MKWTILFHGEFEPEFDQLPVAVQDELYAEAGFVELFGPACGRPHVDTLKGSAYANMKEPRFEATDGEWQVAFAFDQSARQSCWWPATRPAVARRSFTSG